MNENIEKPTFKQIVLLNLQQLTNFPYIEKDFDALTDYGLLCKVVDKMNEVITNTNNQDGYIVELYNSFLELQGYVDNKILELTNAWNNDIEELTNDFNDLHDYVMNYLTPEVLQPLVNNIVNQLIATGDLYVSTEYDSTNERLDIVVTREGD